MNGRALQKEAAPVCRITRFPRVRTFYPRAISPMLWSKTIHPGLDLAKPAAGSHEENK